MIEEIYNASSNSQRKPSEELYYMNFRIILESLFASVLYTLICIATHQTYFIGIFECFLCKNQDGWCLREKDVNQRSSWGTFRKSVETEEKGGHLEWSNEWGWRRGRQEWPGEPPCRTGTWDVAQVHGAQGRASHTSKLWKREIL